MPSKFSDFFHEFDDIVHANTLFENVFYPIWEAASLDEWLYNGGPYQMIVLHFLLGVASYMGREWELSYRLGLLETLNNSKNNRIRCYSALSNASPEDWDSETPPKDTQSPHPPESGELTRKGKKDFLLPESETFLRIIDKRSNNNKSFYLTFIQKMIEKQSRYKETSVKVKGKVKKSYTDTKTGKAVYVEKHRILPGYEGGQYDDNNVILLTFPEHAMIHYLRYLEYGKVQDFRAYKIMTGDLNEETRRKTASLAGKIGGTAQQKLLKANQQGWFNSASQSQRGKKGAASARAWYWCF